MERQEVEDLWRRRLADAKLRLDFAGECVNEAQRDDISPDGARERALRAQNVALAEYTRILRSFSDLVLDGKIPDGWRQAN